MIRKEELEEIMLQTISYRNKNSLLAQSLVGDHWLVICLGYFQSLEQCDQYKWNQGWLQRFYMWFLTLALQCDVNLAVHPLQTHTKLWNAEMCDKREGEEGGKKRWKNGEGWKGGVKEGVNWKGREAFYFFKSSWHFIYS